MRRHSRAFTLIELLCIVGMVAVLAAISVPNFLEAQTRSKTARAHEELASIRSGLYAYYSDHRAYPPMRPESLAFIKGITAKQTLGAGAQNGRFGMVDPFGEDTARGPHLFVWRELTALTTPVAYIGTAVPTDIYSVNGQGPYTYLNFTELARTFPDKWEGTHDNAFLVFSIGPDQDGSYYRRNRKDLLNGPFVPYDPTNGTLTEGDILYFDRR